MKKQKKVISNTLHQTLILVFVGTVLLFLLIKTVFL